MTTAQTFTKSPVLAVFDNPQVHTFGEIRGRHRGWTYVAFPEGDGEDLRYNHYAVCGRKIVTMDFTGFREMPPMVFEWMVKLDFPNRKDVELCSNFKVSALGALTEYDVERIMLWRTVQDKQAA